MIYSYFFHFSTEENKETVKKIKKMSKKAEFAEAYFHIIVSPTLLDDPMKGDVHVAFNSTKLGGWKCRKHKMKCKR